MTSYSRSVIPGRQPGEGDLDKQMFGEPKAKAAPANDAAEDEDDDPPPIRERRTSKRRKDDFLPLAGDGRPKMKPPEERKAPLVLIGVLITVAVFGVVVWNAYQQGVRPEDGAATPQLADDGPFKAKPFAEPTPATGVEQAGVFERMEKGKSAPGKLAHNPDVRDEPAAATTTAAPAPAKPAPAPAASKPAVVAAATPAPAAPAPTPTPAPAAKVAAATPAPATPAPTPPKAAAAAPAAATPAPAAPAPLAVPTAAPAPQKLAGGYTPAFAADGKYVVQVAAPSTEAAANAEWDKKLKAMPELFGSAERIVVRADVNGKTVYRVRAGSFATSADAEGFCAAIKAKGGDCFRTAK